LPNSQSTDVADWTSQQPIVETSVAFLWHLFEEGGPRADMLGCSHKPMDLRRIRHFFVLAETLNFRRAAE
jgi:hypothetical protein